MIGTIGEGPVAVKRKGGMRTTVGALVAERLAEVAARAGLSAAALRVAVGRRVVASADWGARRLARPHPVGPNDLFDAASLTKPFVATLALRLDASGTLPLDLPIGDLLPSARLALARERLESLLRHRARLVAWYPLEKLQLGEGVVGGEPGRRTEALLDWLGRRAPLGAAPGTYSDLGFLFWGLLAERATGRSLARLLRGEVTAPLGVASDVTDRPSASRSVDCALDGGREAALAAALGVRLRRPDAVHRGAPQDGNARFVGRLCGHAGLFVTADALLALGWEWLRPRLLLTPEQVARALGGPRGPFALGWARRRRSGSSGLALSGSSFGHTGFTGGSLWIDPERKLRVVLLSHRRSTALDLNPLRRELHRWAVRELAALGAR